MVLLSLRQSITDERVDVRKISSQLSSLMAKVDLLQNTMMSDVTLSSGETYRIPAGQNLCWRVPPPSYKVYTVLRCDPPFQELNRVRPGDGQCNRYEDRQ